MGPAEYHVIHKHLHSETEQIVVEGTTYQVEQTRGLRYIRVGKIVFAQQDKRKNTMLALRAAREPITRIIRTGEKWGWISNSEIADPLLQE